QTHGEDGAVRVYVCVMGRGWPRRAVRECARHAAGIVDHPPASGGRSPPGTPGNEGLWHR
ncbi:MAG: hypothetical protein M0Z85_11240, partial [Gammaproteobacteria bacterium]|nr:hypothetical protein [Gammaproteobacteria bacterium]